VVSGTACSITERVEDLDLALGAKAPRAKGWVCVEERDRNSGTTKDFPGAGEVPELSRSWLGLNKRDMLRTALCPKVVAGNSCGCDG
jgi:hypothetical protein